MSRHCYDMEGAGAEQAVFEAKLAQNAGRMIPHMVFPLNRMPENASTLCYTAFHSTTHAVTQLSITGPRAYLHGPPNLRFGSGPGPGPGLGPGLALLDRLLEGDDVDMVVGLRNPSQRLAGR